MHSTCMSAAKRKAMLQSRATEVFGDRQHAEHWLSSPCEQLAAEIPIQLASTSEGFDLVIYQLAQIEHGHCA